MTGRTVLVQASPRTPPGLLTFQAWEELRAAGVVMVRALDQSWSEAFSQSGIDVRVSPDDAAGAGQVWFDAASDDGLARALAELAVRGETLVEVVLGSYDLPGSRLLDLVRVMDRLRSPGGCPWDAEQTHSSLLRYLVEESYEVVEAVEAGSREDLAEELGDLLLQVVFHARLATEHDEAPFDIDDVATGIVEKLVRRHPHVFAGGPAGSAEHVEDVWERSKAVEKGRDSALDGIPTGLPALARAEKVLDRLTRHGVSVALPEPVDVGTRLL
ncbi:MAG TPA: MazG family protein, partial [Actinomycetales bacterium]|nr:MazG family protein [Actinomycetales bacterium]